MKRLLVVNAPAADANVITVRPGAHAKPANADRHSDPGAGEVEAERPDCDALTQVEAHLSSAERTNATSAAASGWLPCPQRAAIARRSHEAKTPMPHVCGAGGPTRSRSVRSTTWRGGGHASRARSSRGAPRDGRGPWSWPASGRGRPATARSTTLGTAPPSRRGRMCSEL